MLAFAAGLVCARSGGGGPADDAVRLVPAGALAYVHVSTDRGRESDRRLERLATQLPPLGRLRDRLAGAISPRPLDFERDVRPWLGDELAYAAISATDSLVLASVADRARAEALVGRGLAAAPRYRGVPVLVTGGSAVAFVGDFLAVGSDAAVHAAIDRDHGIGEGLVDLPAYRAATRDRPDERSADAYASTAGVRTILPPLPGALLDRPGLTAAAGSLTAADPGLRVQVRLAGGAPRDAAFDPVLLERVPEQAAAYAGVRSALRLARVLDRLGLGRRFERLGENLAAEAGIDFDRDLLAPLSGELALSVTGATDDRAAGGGAPVVTLKARTVDPRRTEAALARLQDPFARRLALPGTVPAFEPVTIGGLDAYTLRVTPMLAPSYAVADRAVVLSTAPAGIESPRGTLAAAPGFEATVGEVPEKADSLVFLDLRALSALAEETGLTAIPGLATARDDLSRVRAAGAVITQDTAHPSDTTAELFLEIP